MIARDPVNAIGHANLGLAYFYAGRLDEAIAQFPHGAAAWLRVMRGAHYADRRGAAAEGRCRRPRLTEMQKEPDEVWRLLGLSMAYHALGRKAESDAALAELIKKYEQDCGLQHRLRAGLPRRGRPRLRVAGQGGDLPRPGPRPRSRPSRCSPTSTTTRAGCRSCASIGMAPEQLAAIKFDVKVPN